MPATSSAGTSRDRHVSVYLSADEQRRLQEVARENACSISQVLRYALIEIGVLTKPELVRTTIARAASAAS